MHPELAALNIEHKPECPHRIRIISAPHLCAGLDPKTRRIVTRRICAMLRKMEKRDEIRFDAIAACGLSGLLFAPIVAMNLNKTLLIVRKGESCHSSALVEGDHGARSFLILDDFIASGETVNRVIAAIAEEVPLAQCVGMLSYNHISNDEEYKGWKGYRGTHAERLLRFFCGEYSLRAYNSEIKIQEMRAANTIARGFATVLQSVAVKERVMRGQ